MATSGPRLPSGPIFLEMGAGPDARRQAGGLRADRPSALTWLLITTSRPARPDAVGAPAPTTKNPPLPRSRAVPTRRSAVLAALATEPPAAPARGKKYIDLRRRAECRCSPRDPRVTGFSTGAADRPQGKQVADLRVPAGCLPVAVTTGGSHHRGHRRARVRCWPTGWSAHAGGRPHGSRPLL